MIILKYWVDEVFRMKGFKSQLEKEEFEDLLCIETESWPSSSKTN